ncbi:hypothetical protein BJV78DRAFT_1363340 [Lactifluus subvellereus]|nr:hypothetical protein BJV78DRAFT_1363340 [Lactifluus subvellereus]
MSSSTTAHPKSAQKGSFFDFLKPRYHEAVFRLRNSLIALVTLLTLTHLLPLPTPYASAWKFYRDSFQSSWEKSVAVTELLLFGVLLANVLQASIAIRSPPAPYPPLPSPSKPLSPPPPRSKGPQHLTATPPNWRSKMSGGLSPNTTPQRQLAFSTSSAGVGVGGVAGAGSASDPRGVAQSYTLTFNHLSSPSPASPDLSFGSSTGSLPPSPSPVQVTSPLAAYRGRRPPTGRALDGSLLARLALGDSDSDVDD